MPHIIEKNYVILFQNYIKSLKVDGWISWIKKKKDGCSSKTQLKFSQIKKKKLMTRFLLSI